MNSPPLLIINDKLTWTNEFIKNQSNYKLSHDIIIIIIIIENYVLFHINVSF
jgi:hypothetical protein